MFGQQGWQSDLHCLYELADDGGTRMLTLTQDNNATRAEADTMGENNWGLVLLDLKATAEQ